MRSGRRAVVTGGGRGIGRAIAAALTAAGHEVIVLGRSEDKLRAVVEAGEAVAYYVVNVTDEAALAATVARVLPVDILVNNAGIADSARFARTDLAFFRRLMAVNFESAVTAIHGVLPGMIERGFGRIISVASMAGLKGYPYVTAYVASKHAIVGLTRALAREVATTGVTVNAVCPGYVDTDLVADSAARIASRTGRTVDEARAELIRDNPQGRFITPEEVADAVVWLSGDLAGAVTGEAIPVAGGES